jgi:hypothetical protein
MRTLPFLLVLSACGSSKLVIDGDTGEVVVDDTAVADTGDTAGGDTSSSTDSGSTDTQTPPDTGVTEPDTTVTYVGTLEGRLSIRTREGSESTDCRGDVRLVRSPDGVIWGQAACDARDWRLDFAGDVEATWSGGSWDGDWRVEAGRDSVDVPLDGTIDDRTLDADVTYDADWLAFEGTIRAAAQ